MAKTKQRAITWEKIGELLTTDTLGHSTARNTFDKPLPSHSALSRQIDKTLSSLDTDIEKARMPTRGTY